MIVGLNDSQTITIEYNGNVLMFPTKSVINKRNLPEKNQTVLLNAYLKWKSEDYKDLLWDKLKLAKKAVDDTLVSDKLEYIKEIYDIIDIIDIGDITNFVIEVYKLRAPSGLFDKFTDELRDEGRYNEDQTFIKREYLELVALSVAGKILLGPIVYFLYVNQDLCGKNIDSEGFHFIKRSKLYHTPPMQKTLSMIQVLVDNIETSSFVIDHSLPKKDIPVYVLAWTFFQRISTATVVDDDNKGNIVTNVYQYAGSKLNSSGDVSRVIRDSKPTSKSSDENSASVIEVLKAVSDATPGDIVTMNVVNRNIPTVLHNAQNFISDKVTVEEATDALIKLEIFKEAAIPDQSNVLTAIILKSVTPAPSKDNLELDSYLARLAVCYVFLKNAGFPELATIITSRVVYGEGGLNLTTNRDRLSRETKEQLSKYYENNADIEEWINKLPSTYLDEHWTSVIDNVDDNMIIVSNLKPLLANLLIYIEENTEI